MKLVFQTTPKESVEVFNIAASMNQDPELSPAFIKGAVELAVQSQGAFDLMCLWRDERDPEERALIIADLQEAIEDTKDAPSQVIKKPKLNFADFDEVLKDVKSFKKKLRDLVDQRGGISHLAKLTGIPQPSLSRFFSSSSMPRRTTLYKIAEALDLEEKDIVTEYLPRTRPPGAVSQMRNRHSKLQQCTHNHETNE